MIQHGVIHQPFPESACPRPEGSAPAFVTLWATGADPARDGLFRLLAMKPDGSGAWSAFDQLCDPFPEAPQEAATARMAREFGVHQADIRDCPDSREGWLALEEFLGDAPVITLDGPSFEAWADALGSEQSRQTLGLDELALLLAPGRLATRGESLLHALAPGPAPTGTGHQTRTPHMLLGAIAELAGRFLSQEPLALSLALTGFTRALQGLEGTDPAAAARLAFALELLNSPSRWALSTGELFTCPPSLRDGILEQLPDASDDLDLLLDSLAPAATEDAPWRKAEELPAAGTEEAGSHPEDVARLDDLFEVHLPALLAEEMGGVPETYYRSSQHAIAKEVARTLGRDELLLVHAPTGTGKTLAYLLPAILWARRNGLRAAIATYTRALQEQAMDREVPRALASLARSGFPGTTHISVLKGRENYLCFRALRVALPEAGDDPEVWLAWTSLALFALSDPDGDLDRFPRRPPLRMTSSAHYRSVAGGLVHAVRARSGCCSGKEDKASCCANLAARKASRSHVVITNQALMLARGDMFKHVIFDECEHLHSVAHSAWSHEIRFGLMRETLLRLHRPGRGRSNRPLDSLAAKLPLGSGAQEELSWAKRHWDRTTAALHVLEEQVEAFDRWRGETQGKRPAREEHALFREYVDGDSGPELMQARVETTRAMNDLEGSLERLLETTEPLGLLSFARTRRTLELSRADLVDLVTRLCAWLPEDEGQVALSKRVFHDASRDGRGELQLSAQILLPGEQLGRVYYPTLASGVFLSATTCLASGFAPAMAYLGLDWAQKPGPDDGYTGREVRTFSAPEVFDYSRVLVGIPRDMPRPGEKAAHRAYITGLIDWLGARTRGRILVLFTNLEDVRLVGEALASTFAERQIPLWYQGMDGVGKEELADLFRERVDSILLGVDTFWYGADFPGETLEYLVIARLPYGVPDRYHFAQCATLGERDQRKRIYMPRALAKMRQGFGRLMRRTSDRGCVLVVDPRILDPRHRTFMRELPVVTDPMAKDEDREGLARLVRGDSRMVLRECLSHMGMLADVRRRGLSEDFDGGWAGTQAPEASASEIWSDEPVVPTPPPARPPPPAPAPDPVPEPAPIEFVDIPRDDLPF